ncbi:NADPH-dependent FMN reductase [Chitinophaga sp. Cy-1792]|uniref:NADPH-dependent FMN reductase n=1 Tax=Chitinophaga sp. Cy-1792 TaxID=2608339 RepID=UPI00141E45CD|nr:NAD(P)H-dependent oxidoreductase [Chitinophaga sp. Cy-1792]NIG57456.1 NAD(P)H-dependent oxidoreductase [Chitinophaga sp. Cy-1792]
MKVLLFNGSLEKKPTSTSYAIINYLQEQLHKKGATTTVFNLAEADIPFFDTAALQQIPESAREMTKIFREADLHIWLTPLYHGSMTGAMKNCLDWIEISSKEPVAYLTNKVVGMVCWAEGGHALQGINTMEAVAKALRAWVLPYSVPVVRGHLYNTADYSISKEYQQKFDLLVNLLTDVKFQFA